MIVSIDSELPVYSLDLLHCFKNVYILHKKVRMLWRMSLTLAINQEVLDHNVLENTNLQGHIDTKLWSEN